MMAGNPIVVFVTRGFVPKVATVGRTQALRMSTQSVVAGWSRGKRPSAGRKPYAGLELKRSEIGEPQEAGCEIRKEEE